MSKGKQATTSKELYSRLMDQSVPKSELEWYASRIIRGCMKAMPCGNITTHTPSNLARRIRDMVKELTIYDIDLDRAEDEIKELKSRIEICRARLDYLTIEYSKPTSEYVQGQYQEAFDMVGILDGKA